MAWGYHLILQAANCSPMTIRNPHTIGRFTKNLVRSIDMVPYGKPLIVMFGTGNKKGYTLVQLIETSNISAHFVEETNDMYLDVFSCKTFDPKIVNIMVKNYFKPEKLESTIVTRDARKLMSSIWDVEDPMVDYSNIPKMQ